MNTWQSIDKRHKSAYDWWKLASCIALEIVSRTCMQKKLYCFGGFCCKFSAPETGFKTHSQFQCSKVRSKSASLQTVYLSCVWKGIWSWEQKSVPESRHATLYGVKVIKKSRLASDRLLILWSLHGSLRCCETDRETDYTTFWSLDVERGQLWCAQNCTRNCCIFKLCLSARVIAFEIFCLHLTEIMRIRLMFARVWAVHLAWCWVMLRQYCTILYNK